MSKGGGKEVEKPQTSKNNKQRNVTTHSDIDADIGDLYEEADESGPTSPTPATKGPIPSIGEHPALRSVDRQWTALESDNALERILQKLNRLTVSNDRNRDELALQISENAVDVPNAVEEVLDETLGKIYKRIAKRQGEAAEAIARVEGMAAGGMVALSEKLDKLLGRGEGPKVEALECKIEEVSGQLVSMAQHVRSQQRLLDSILEKVSTPSPPQQTQSPG